MRLSIYNEACSSDCECKQNSGLSCGANSKCECPSGSQWYWSDIAGYVIYFFLKCAFKSAFKLLSSEKMNGFSNFPINVQKILDVRMNSELKKFFQKIKFYSNFICT